MALEFPEPSTSPRRLFAVGYGAPGSGKSRWGAAASAVFGKTAYIDVDDDEMQSILPEHKKNLTRIRFEGDNPIDNMNEIAIHDWKKDGFELLVVDTLTHGAKGMLKYAANKGFFRGKDGVGHIIFGPKDAEITQAIPSLADYGGGKWLVENWLDTLKREQKDLHVLVLCHEDLDIPKKDDPSHVTTIGGPATFGRAMLREFPAYFPAIVRLEVREKTDLAGKATAKYRAISTMQGAFVARIKEAKEKGNPMPVVELERNPEHWWKDFVNHFMKEAS